MVSNFNLLLKKLEKRSIIVLSLLGLSTCSGYGSSLPIVNCLCFLVTNPYIYISFRFLAGLFDCVLLIVRSYLMDMHTEKEYITANNLFESVWYICPCIGSFISACLSLINIKITMFALVYSFLLALAQLALLSTLSVLYIPFSSFVIHMTLI